jgi:hypothetical protein
MRCGLWEGYRWERGRSPGSLGSGEGECRDGMALPMAWDGAEHEVGKGEKMEFCLGFAMGRVWLLTSGL